LLREASQADVEAIRRWRNHPKVREASIWTGAITAEGHARWWTDVREDPAKRVLIFEYRGVSCGVVTFKDHDPNKRSAEWGFFLDVDGLGERGELVPAWIELEKEAIDYGFGKMMLRTLGGRTLAWNKPVLDLHRRFGFAEVSERGYVANVGGPLQAVVWTEMTADDRHL